MLSSCLQQSRQSSTDFVHIKCFVLSMQMVKDKRHKATLNVLFMEHAKNTVRVSVKYFFPFIIMCLLYMELLRQPSKWLWSKWCFLLQLINMSIWTRKLVHVNFGKVKDGTNSSSMLSLQFIQFRCEMYSNVIVLNRSWRICSETTVQNSCCQY